MINELWSQKLFLKGKIILSSQVLNLRAESSGYFTAAFFSYNFEKNGKYRITALSSSSSLPISISLIDIPGGRYKSFENIKIGDSITFLSDKDYKSSGAQKHLAGTGRYSDMMSIKIEKLR